MAAFSLSGGLHCRLRVRADGPGRCADNCTGEAEEVALVGDDECVPLDTTSVKRLWAKAECDPEPEQTSTQAFEVALTMNIVITLVVFLLFALIFPHFNNVYQPRVRLAAKPPKPLPKVHTPVADAVPKAAFAVLCIAPACCLCAGAWLRLPYAARVHGSCDRGQPQFRGSCVSRRSTCRAS